MGRLAPNRLSARAVAVAKEGAHADGAGLWLMVDGASRRWAFRFTSPVTGVRREMGLGSAREVSLAEARDQAIEARKALRAGADPIEQRRAIRPARRKTVTYTFADVAAKYVQDQRAGWKDPRRPSNWTRSLTLHAFPTIGSRPIEKVATDDVLAILRPIWAEKTETAERLRARIERILDYARTQGLREGENPARWRGHLSHALPKPSAVKRVEHHGAVPWKGIAEVMVKLSQAEGRGALAVRFACLTAARSGEVRGATWGEVDPHARTWTLSGRRMKMKKEHRVPLSEAALAILEGLKQEGTTPGDLIFPGGRQGTPLSDVALSKALHTAAGTKAVTVHGLRSTFRDWAAEATDYPAEVAEMALAHVVGNKVEAAYRRGDLFEKRRAIMGEWAAFAAE